MHVIITGASSGLGEGMARDFASAGWSLTLVARREPELRALAGAFKAKAFAGDTHVIAADLSDLERCAGVIDEAEAALGPADVLVNNAGIQYVEPTVGITPERGELLMAVNLLSPLRMTWRVLPGMIERRSGTIVNIASMAAVTPTPGMCHYNASKAGLAAASESLRVELKDTGVNVVTVYPGPVTSPMESVARESFTGSWATRNVPTGTPDEMARLVREAIVKGKPRLFYPKVYGVTRYSRVMSQWFTDTFTPPLKGEGKDEDPGQ